MNIRARAVLVITLTNLVIIMFSVFVGINYVERNIDISQETDLAVVALAADRFISSELDIVMLKAGRIAEILGTSEESRWANVLSLQHGLFPEFMGLSVFDADTGLIASAGALHAENDVMNDRYIKQAFSSAGHTERRAISSTRKTTDGVVFFVGVPVPFSHNKVLVVTLSGRFFKQRLSDFVIWETGHVFISDSLGYVISNPREHWLQDRFNYITAAQTDKDFTELAATVTRMTQGETGTGYYSIYGIPRICSFRPVSGSGEGWSLGVVAPLTESPVKDIDKGLLVVALVSIILSIIAAVIASIFIKKPFEEIAVLKEGAETANKAKSAFLNTMSHEIRTPMNAILGISEIQLQKESLDPDMKESLEKIHSSGDLLLSIINDILDLSKIEADKLELITAKYEIASMISDTVQLNMMRIGSKPIELDLQVNENIPAQMLGDELRIKQILNNLLSNAFKYTAEGTVKLSVDTEDGKNSDEVVLVMTVSDTGQGMTEEQLGMLFDEYSRFNTETNRSTEGTGLGMSITRKLVNMMNGKINVASEPGKGSVFTVNITQGRCESTELGSDVAENLRQFRTHSRTIMKRVQISREPMPYGSILVVDDVEANIYVAKGLLSPYRLKFSSANSGAAAIEKIKNGNVYDIIFMDHMMPEMDGIEAVKHIRGFGYKAPIIALTANAVSGQSEIFLQNGFDDFISKPIDIRQLNMVLNKFVRDKQPQEAIDAVTLQVQLEQDTSAAGVNAVISDNVLSIKIAGLDVIKGLQRFDNEESFYLRVLRTYAANVSSKLKEMETVNEETLESYKIKVHGIKGTSLEIFAEQVSKEAGALEAAAKSGDIDYINNHNPSFLKVSRKLVSDIEDVLAGLEAENPKPKKNKPDDELLLKLLAACEKYDMDKADEAMTEIEEYQYDSDEGLVYWLRENIDIVNFEEAAEKLNGLLK